MKNYLQIVMDALALDGEGQNWSSFIDLDAHDRQYHHGHYDGGTCSLRDKLGTATQPGGLLDGMPSLDQFNNIVRQAINSGMIDENGREEINNILNDVANGLQNWEGGDEASVRQSVEEMKELYEGLRDAFAQQVREQDVETPNADVEPVNEVNSTEPAQPQPTAYATNGTPTEEQIESAIDRMMETYPNGSRNDIRDVFNRIANGDTAMARAAHQTLLQAVGADDPVMRFVQGVIDGTQTPNQAEAVQTPQTQTPQPMPTPAQATAAEPVTQITDVIHRRPDVAINIAANKAPRSMNESLRRIAAQAVGRTSMQLRREGMGQATREILMALQNGTMNDAGRRYLLAMEQAAINGHMGAQSYPNVVVRAANRINPSWRNQGSRGNGTPRRDTSVSGLSAIPIGTSYRGLYREDQITGTSSFDVEQSQFAIDNRLLEEARIDYEARRSSGGTSELEDKLASHGLYIAKEKVPPVTIKRSGMTCFACHAVSALRALLNVPVRPNAFAGHLDTERNKGAVWGQVRCLAFPDAKPLLNRNTAREELRRAPVGSVIMTTSGGHCWALKKNSTGRWTILETYSGRTVVLYNETEVIDNMSFPGESEFLRKDRVVAARKRMLHAPDDTNPDLLFVAKRGSILITPQAAQTIRPEYISGAITGVPYDASNVNVSENY